MAAQPLLCVGENINPDFYRSVMAAFVALGITPRIVQQANSLVVLSLVETGMGIGIVSSALRWRITPHLLMRRVEEFLPSTSVDLVWRRNDKSGVLGSFVDCATAALIGARQRNGRGEPGLGGLPAGLGLDLREFLGDTEGNGKMARGAREC
jgi:DNA-binding transcriptional LysR family regulator